MKKNILINLLSLAVTFSMFTGCTAQASTGVPIPTSNSAISSKSTSIPVNTVDTSSKYTTDDMNSSWDKNSATNITLNGTSITVNGAGAVANGNVLTINSGGTYVISGTLSDGQIVINATKDDTVKLILNGADITNKTGAGIYAPQCDKLIITLADSTKNVITDGGSNFVYKDLTNEEPDAAIFCNDDLIFNGTGELKINALFNNGIGTKDDIVIVSGNYTINAKNHGVRGRDSVTILDGNFSINAGNDGIQSNNDEDTKKGWISLEGGTYNIIAAHDGVSAETVLSILDGKYNVTSGGGVSKASLVASNDTTSDSFKGLKASTDLIIANGSFVIDSLDDSIHTNGNISINGGELTLSTGDDGIHADGNLNVSGGNIKVATSCEGLEAATIDILGGTININSSDDGLNAAGGENTSAEANKPPMQATNDYYINIAGGTVTLFAGGDGIDSNGALNISGGNVTSLIQSTPDNGAIDTDGSISITGGTVIYGGSGVGGVTNNTQSYVYITGASAGKEITVKKDGKTLVSFNPTIDCQYLVISSKEIINGESYEIYSGGTMQTTVTAGTGGGGMGRPGGKGRPGSMGR